MDYGKKGSALAGVVGGYFTSSTHQGGRELTVFRPKADSQQRLDISIRTNGKGTVAEMSDNEKVFKSDVREMWAGGPSRRWSLVRRNVTDVTLATGGYASAYVCQQCDEAVAGVYRVEKMWICAACRELRLLRMAGRKDAGPVERGYLPLGEDARNA